jgi:hypothetical protein
MNSHFFSHLDGTWAMRTFTHSIQTLFSRTLKGQMPPKLLVSSSRTSKMGAIISLNCFQPCLPPPTARHSVGFSDHGPADNHRNSIAAARQARVRGCHLRSPRAAVIHRPRRARQGVCG